jgi:hypothetical protein
MEAAGDLPGGLPALLFLAPGSSRVPASGDFDLPAEATRARISLFGPDELLQVLDQTHPPVAVETLLQCLTAVTPA